jgi:phosphatidylserine/phosphatidylglycerophosphate/cardiolipin synthase-like enzyme
VDGLLNLSDRDLQELAAALRAGRLTLPFSAMSLQRLLASAASPQLLGDLMLLVQHGFSEGQIALTLGLLSAQRARRPHLDEIVQVVATGPEAEGSEPRDTQVVVRNLFANAKQDILLAGYAVYQGQRVFQSLADRMTQLAHLRVRFFLDVPRGFNDTTNRGELVRRFAHRFVTTQWPVGCRLPDIYYDPRSLDDDPSQRTALHAKCIVVDGAEVFVSSANFTEAAQQRNIEIGLLLRSQPTALAIACFFDARIHHGLLTHLKLV